MRRIIGLTGGIGCGKSTVLRLFEELGIDTIDVDEISRKITLPGGCAIKAICDTFGPSAIDCSGAMDRNYIRNLVFDNPEERKKLENLLHPIIQNETLKLIEHTQSPYCVVEIPLLMESKFWLQKVNRILLIDATKENQIIRVKQRNGFSLERILSIIDSQKNRKERIQIADDIIVNDGSISNLNSAIQQLHQKYDKNYVIG
ncbi:MAG: dephospho-CoA kinase [Burkholderiaceae bacterium]|nr:dephospho-CoA kinase [Burkholderiaceae bacterium]